MVLTEDRVEAEHSWPLIPRPVVPYDISETFPSIPTG